MDASLLRRMRGSTTLKGVARLGLVGRGVFYLVLTALAVSLLVEPHRSGPQANANGALSEVTKQPVGVLLTAVAAIGFVAFGALRLAGAATDDRQGRLRRLSTAGQGLVYLGLAATTTLFLLGQRATGSEQQQRRTTGSVLSLPGGRLLVAAAGVTVIAACCWQLTVAVKGHFADTLHTEQMGARLRGLFGLTARTGIPARALAFAPVGVFLTIAAVRSDPRRANGLDALLLDWPGPTGAGWPWHSWPPGSPSSPPTPSSRPVTGRSHQVPKRRPARDVDRAVISDGKPWAYAIAQQTPVRSAKQPEWPNGSRAGQLTTRYAPALDWG